MKFKLFCWIFVVVLYICKLNLKKIFKRKRIYSSESCLLNWLQDICPFDSSIHFFFFSFASHFFALTCSLTSQRIYCIPERGFSRWWKTKNYFSLIIFDFFFCCCCCCLSSCFYGIQFALSIWLRYYALCV